MVWNPGDYGYLLQLRSEFACIPQFGNEAIADDQHKSSSLDLFSSANHL
jgi:hypothetical protein